MRWQGLTQPIAMNGQEHSCIEAVKEVLWLNVLDLVIPLHAWWQRWAIHDDVS